MRHIVNVGLLVIFLALAVTGLMSFALPFSITTTQIHIVAGLSMTLLVVLHVAGRIPYLKKQFLGGKGAAIGRTSLIAIVLISGALLFLAATGRPPASWLVSQSYESRNRAQIVRSSSLTGFGELTEHRRLVTRKSSDPKSRGLSLSLSFTEKLSELPAIAVWAETTAGTLIETLHLEQSLAYSDKPVWADIRTQRNHILPIWRHRHTLVSGINPDGDVDVVSGATETHSFALDPYLIPDKGHKFILFVEINAPKDPNENWTDETIGQPSILYSALIKVDDEQSYKILELTGHGGDAESSGDIQYDLEGFTSALKMVDLFLAKVER